MSSAPTRSRALPVASSGARPLPLAAAEVVPVPAAPFAAAAPTSEWSEWTEEELRTSDTTQGFQYSRIKGVWYTLRIILGLPLLPLWPFFIAKEAGDWSIARNYFGTMAYCLRTILTHVRFGSFVRMLKYNLVMGPDQVKARIAKRRGACTRCAKCCKQYSCIFLGKDTESKEYYCKVYQTDYWYYGTCGRYPLDQRDIDDHACPGFSFQES